jgi:hypothetical protein
MADDIRGSAGLVINRVHARPSGRFAIAVHKTGKGSKSRYNVFYSDSQSTDTNVSQAYLQRLKKQGYTVVAAETPAQHEHLV